MLKFIKSLFKQKEKVGITTEDLEDWFSQKTKGFYDCINSNIKEVKQSIIEEIQKTKDNLKNLENATLRNDKITTKELQFMEGNRSFYIKRINIFIGAINIPEENIVEFIAKTHNSLNELSKSTHKAYQILQHFFGDESYKIAQNLKKIDSNLVELNNSVSNKKISQIEEIKKDIAFLKESIKRKEQLKNNIEKTEKTINDFEKEKKNILSEISHKEQSSEYKEYHRLQVDEYKLNEQLDDLKEGIGHYFSVLEHSLKKHMNLNPEDERLLTKYLSDPISALVEDYKLDIIKILERVKDNILLRKIELKDQKKEKTLITIDKITEAKLTSFLTNYNSLMVDLRKISDRIGSHTVIEEIDKIKDQLENKKQEAEKEHEKLAEIKENLNKIDINSIKKDLKEKIEDLLDIDLEID